LLKNVYGISTAEMVYDSGIVKNSQVGISAECVYGFFSGTTVLAN
jgi:hypothetical protein